MFLGAGYPEGGMGKGSSRTLLFRTTWCYLMICSEVETYIWYFGLILLADVLNGMVLVAYEYQTLLFVSIYIWYVCGKGLICCKKSQHNSPLTGGYGTELFFFSRADCFKGYHYGIYVFFVSYLVPLTQKPLFPKIIIVCLHSKSNQH